MNNRGFSLVEALMAMAIFAIVATGLVGVMILGRSSSTLVGKRYKAEILAEEGLEATRNIRDADFDNLNDGTYGLDISGGSWQFVSSPETIDIYDRVITISTVSNDIKRVDSEVTWMQNLQRDSTVALTTYLTRWRDTITNPASWANPATEAIMNLTQGNSGAKVVTQGNYVYVAREGSSTNFVVIDVSSGQNPQVVGQLSISGNLTDITLINSNYAAISSTHNSAELVIVDISNPSNPGVVKTLNLNRNNDALTVDSFGNYLYVGRKRDSLANEFYVINASNPTNISVIGSINFSNDINSIAAYSEDRVFAATSDTNKEVIYVSTQVKAVPVVLGEYNHSGSNKALSIAVSGENVLAGLDSGEMPILNTSTPSSMSLLSTYNAEDSINDISINPGNTLAYLATKEKNKEFQVVDISNVNSPTLFGFYDASKDALAVDYNPTHDRAALITAENNGEFIWMKPQ